VGIVYPCHLNCISLLKVVDFASPEERIEAGLVHLLEVIFLALMASNHLL
jgi:hypothetical protein